MTANPDNHYKNLADRLRAMSPDKRAAAEQLLKKKGVAVADLSVTTAEPPSIVPVARDRDLPLSFDQQRVWFLHQLAPLTSVFNLQMSMGLRVEVAVLEQVLTALVARHEILRTTYRMGEREPVQIIHLPHPVALPAVDLSGLSDEDAGAEVLSAGRQQRTKPFDLEAGPVWRALAFKLGNGRAALSMVINHIATDGWSFDRLFQEVRELCDAFTAGRETRLPELPIQYADYAVWQRQWLQGEVLETQLRYWRERLAGMPAALELLTDHPRPPVQTSNGAGVGVQLPGPLVAGLKALAQKYQATLFMTLLAVFKILLARHAGQQDVVVGTPIAGRMRPEVENVQGLFLNTLVLRTDLSGDPAFGEILGRVRDTVLGAFAHQHVPFEKLVEALQPQRDLSRNPLFQAFFNKPIMQEANTAPGTRDLFKDTIAMAEGQAEFDVALWVEEYSESIDLGFNFNTDLYRSSTIERMAGHFVRLLEAVVGDSEQRLSSLPLLTEGERHRLLEEWNQTEQVFPGDPVSRLFEQQVAQIPEAVALEFEGERLSYRELNARANRLAHYLRRLGVGADVKVGVFLERGVQMVVAVLGVLKAGGAYVPLDPAYPSERLAFMLEDSQAAVLLSGERLLSELPVHAARVVRFDWDGEGISAESAENLEVAPDAADLAYIIYTSGSTGKPKGVQIPHRALCNFLHSMLRSPGLKRDDVLVAVTTLSFDIAGLELYLPLIAGARLVPASRETAADGAALMGLLESSGATVMQATPATWRLLLAAGWRGNRQLRVLCGGEALSRELAEQMLECCAQLWNLYGPTETTIWSTAYRVESGSGPVPIGRPIANTRIYVLDDRLQPVPIGVAGELYVGGAGVARGYWQRPELNTERFLADPFSTVPGARLYKTGDRVRYLPDGNIEYFGRLDNQVKLRGFRIELGEIESVLGRLEGVRQAVVQVREDQPGDQRLVAYLVCEDESIRSDERIRVFAGKSLLAYMVPSAYVFLDALPVTPNGKVDRKALPIPESNLRREAGYVEPHTPSECVLASIWCEVLGVDRVSVDDNFFDIGGHSLIAITTIVKFKEQTGRSLDPRNYYQQTLGQLAASVDDGNERTPRTENSSALELEPFYFGDTKRMLFGLFRLAQEPKDVGIVLCQPHAHEYIRCHRAFREMGQRLARLGFHVLSFDYYGTGDSGGDYQEGEVSTWGQDLDVAIDTMKQRLQIHRVCLIGLRMGATLAMMVSAKRTDIAAIALWDPIVSGSDVNAEAAEIRMHQALDPIRQRDVAYPDVLSYPITNEMIIDLERIDLCLVTPSAAMPVLLVIESDGERSGRRLADLKQAAGSRVNYQCIDEPGVWLREPYEAIVPRKVIGTLLSWVSEVFR